MRFRNSRLRAKVTALLLSLIALWAFAAWVTLREGVNLLWVSTLDSNIAQPSDPLLTELQKERRLTVIQLASPGRTQRAALDAQRERTDRARTELVRLAGSGSVGRAADETLEKRLGEMLTRLEGVNSTRMSVDSGGTDRTRALAAYSDVIDSAFKVYDALATLDDKNFARDTRTLIDLNRTWEMLSQEDALLVGALATGRLTATELTQFTQLVGVRRHSTDQALASIRDSDPTLASALSRNDKLAQVQRVEDQIIQNRRVETSRGAGGPVVTTEQWTAASQPALAELRAQVQAAGDRLVERATPIATGVIVRLALAGGLGLLAVIASIVLSVTTVRALMRQLERLRAAAFELAEQRLPGVVERLGRGEKVDVKSEAPPLAFGTDEIGQVGQAFNVVQETAIRTAVEQAELRRSVRDVLLSLARRTQTLVQRQLSMLDTMERQRDIDPKDLEKLFRLDHLATRMRRNAENLIVLSGAVPARGWRRPVPMVDVVRGAIGEVEDYTRVEVLPFGQVDLTGRAVGDVTHLLAELIENAVSFSPPGTVVQISGHLVATGFAVDVEDRGLGMDEERLDEINARIADPPEFNLQSSVQLGLYVVGKLAERYGIQVSLKRSAYGGTTAVVVIPRELIAESRADEPEPLPVGAGATTTANGLDVRRSATLHALPSAPGARQQPRPDNAVLPAELPEPPDEAPEYARTPTPIGTAQPDTARTEAEPRPARLTEVETEPAPVEADEPAHGMKSPTTPPEDLPPVPEISSTPSGLPVRVPQANLADPLRAAEPAVVPQEPEAEDDPGRSPEEIQRIMGSYQSGTRRGRSEAAKSEGENPGEGEDDR